MNDSQLDNTPNKVDITSSVPINLEKAKFESFQSSFTNTQLTNIPELDTPVLGKISGEFGIIDGTSNNKRFYSEHFWRTLLSNPRTVKLLNAGRFFGIFEHPNVKVNYDENGRATARHPKNAGLVTKSLWIDGKIVYGEAYILNTPLGRLLASYLLARDKFDKPLIELYISARGYSKKDYIDPRTGLDMMTPDDYLLDGFDIVLAPGLTHNRIKFESDESEEILRMTEDYETSLIRQAVRDEWNLKSV